MAQPGTVRCISTIFFCFFFFLSFRAAPAAYGCSQARGWIGATAASLHQSYSNARSASHQICDLQCSSWQRRILNSLSKVRDQTCVLMDTSQICFRWATTGAPVPFFFCVYHIKILPMLITETFGIPLNFASRGMPHSLHPEPRGWIVCLLSGSNCI